MIQAHTLILWRKPERQTKSFEIIAKETYELFSIFKDFPQELKPNYLTCRSKKRAREFEWSLQNFTKTLQRGVNKERGKEFVDLGYSISFFSSMQEDESCGFELLVGTQDERFFDVLIIRFPETLNVYDEKTAQQIRGLFKILVQKFRPFWGCISNSAIFNEFGCFWTENTPATVHWINYWSKDIIEAIGATRIKNTLEKYSEVKFDGGILQIKNTAINVEIEGDLNFHKELHNRLFES